MKEFPKKQMYVIFIESTTLKIGNMEVETNFNRPTSLKDLDFLLFLFLSQGLRISTYIVCVIGLSPSYQNKTYMIMIMSPMY